MNFIMDNVIDVPLPDHRSICYTPYDHGMHDEWYEERDNSHQYYGEYLKQYKAGRKNVTMILRTLRNNF